ncbi:hypothetical protein [Bradyrhizobium sp. CCGB01]|uniref:hypothetical protein n=1 Tax=Bradyrhizobium sp. CCGB01 TaxID=2949634 RepID=UPI0020B45991|nr:hypothetical protein [Bradyrhizobium sp. CCGB01]MCP3408326.1 hypothetical protein [Bradyrhizobium sp. CCGB01]
MTTTTRSKAISQLWLSWVAHRLSQIMTAIKPQHRASEIAAVAAASNNPSGA